MSKLLEQLRALPAFNKFEAAVKENLVIDNFYVQHFAPEKNTYIDEKDDDGKQVCYPVTLSDYDIEDEAIDGLINDNTGYFSELVHEVMSDEVEELARVLIKELRK